MRIKAVIKALNRASKCKDMITFNKWHDGLIVEQVTYKADILWTNTDLLRMKELVYEINA